MSYKQHKALEKIEEYLKGCEQDEYNRHILVRGLYKVDHLTEEVRGRTLQRFTQSLVLAAVIDAKGNYSEASENVGISRMTIGKVMQELLGEGNEK